MMVKWETIEGEGPDEVDFYFDREEGKGFLYFWGSKEKPARRVDLNLLLCLNMIDALQAIVDMWPKER